MYSQQLESFTLSKGKPEHFWIPKLKDITLNGLKQGLNQIR